MLFVILKYLDTHMKRLTKAVFPVAGLGTRFLPATKAMPKELLPVIDKPLIQYAVEEAISANIETLIFITGRNKRAIEDHFDRNIELENFLINQGKKEQADLIRSIIPEHVNCVFVRQPKPLGLGHAVVCAESVVGDEPFLVMLADDLLVSKEVNNSHLLVKAYEKEQKTQLSVMEVNDKSISKYGVVVKGESIGEVKGLVEKPSTDNAPSNLASIGRYVLSPDIFNILKKIAPGKGGEIQLADAIDVQANNGGVSSVMLAGKRFDCGSIEGYLDAILYLYETSKKV